MPELTRAQLGKFSRKGERGQALLLFSITLLLLALMVLITLSISSKVKERIELQHVADAAAYSEAVVTARAFNAVSLMNRTQVSHMVALAAVQSLISWSGYSKATMQGAKDAIETMHAACPGPDTTAALDAINAEQGRLNAGWEALDLAAGEQQLRLQGIAGSYEDYEEAIFYGWARTLIEGRGGNQSLAQTIAEQARQGSPWRAHPRELFVDKAVMSGAAYPSITEINNALGNGVNHSVHITMGSRLDPFVSHRANGTEALNAMLGRLIGGQGFGGDVTNQGSGYYASEAWATNMIHSVKERVGGTWGWGDDHGAVTITRSLTCPGQTQTIPLTAWLYSSDSPNRADMHDWSPRWDSDLDPAPDRHTYGGCNPCPGMFPGHLDYNEAGVSDRDNLFAQPKNIVVVQRDLSVRDQSPDPWQLTLRYRFNPASAGTQVDLRKTTAPASQRMQAALSTGIVYYHRGSGDESFNWEHWKEPPNFYNPFWRATLVGTDVDERGANRGNAAILALEQHGLSEQARTIRLLRAAGFRGLQ